jgi:hypothetical protein
MHCKKIILAACLAQAVSSYSYEKNSPDDPLVIDHEADIENVVNLSNPPLLLKPPLSKKQQSWNFSNSGKEIYRQVAISYMGKRLHNGSFNIASVKIMPGDPIFPNLYSKDECQYLSTAALSVHVNNMPWEFSRAVRLWKDLKEGIVGFENSKDIVSFMRIVCLPMNAVDDIDMIGVEYAFASNPKVRTEHADQLSSGKALYVSIDDPRLNFRYDPNRFFERFEKYGVTPKLKVPDTDGREGWRDNRWNTSIKIFPLDAAIDFSY